MTHQQQDTLESVRNQLNFMSGMLLAWDTESIEIGRVEKDGFWYMIECIRKELETIEL